MDSLPKELYEKKEFATELIDESIDKLYDGKLQLSKDIALRAKDIFFEIGLRKEQASILNVLSIIYDELGYKELGLNCIFDALEIAIDENAYDLASKLYNNLGSQFMNTKSFDRALYYFEKALEMLDKGREADMLTERDKTGFVLILNLNLSLTYCMNGERELARHYYDESRKFSSLPGNENLLLTFKAFEGLILWKLGEHELVKANVESIIDIANEMDYSANYIEIMSYIFEVLKEMKDYERWEKVLSIMENRVAGDVGIYVKVEEVKSWLEYYKEVGDREKYTEACVKFYELSLEKNIEDNERNANAIEADAQIRRANREKKHTNEIVYLDPLTGIGNRNKMLEDSTRLIEASIAENHPIAIGLLDVDYFKECNDTYGHLHGDECLKKVTKTIRDAIGGNGNVYRFGGDEFLVMIPDIDDNQILAIGKEIRDNLAKEQIPNIKSPISNYVTISQGYTSAFAERGDSIETLIKLADRVLYSVKRCGRNSYKYTNVADIE